MNLNKQTKAELISKLKNLSDLKNNKSEIKTDLKNQKSEIKTELKNKNIDNSSINKSQNTQIKLFELIILIKNLIIRLTIITLLIKIFKKYKIISQIFRILNWIILSIFGISIIDNFSISRYILEFKLLVGAITSYLTATQFYAYLSGLFGVKVKETVTNPNWPMTKENSRETIRNEIKTRENQRNSKILEWLKTHEELENKDSNNKKYYLLLLLLLSLGIGWYYYNGDISPPKLGFIWGCWQAFRNSMNDLRNINRTVSETNETIQNTKDFLKNNKSDSDIHMSPEMAELSINQIPSAPPAPPAPPIPSTSSGPPAPPAPKMPVTLLDEIKNKKQLHPTDTNFKDGLKKGKVLNESPQTLTEALSSKFDTIRKAVIGSDDESEALINKPMEVLDMESFKEWAIKNNTGDKTPQIPDQNIIESVKGKEKEISPTLSESSPEEMSHYFKKVDGKLINTLTEKSKGLKSLDDLSNEEKDIICEKYSNINTDNLINTLKKFPHSSFTDELIDENINENMKRLIDENPKFNKQQIVELLIKENPGNWEQILPVITLTINEELNKWENKFSPKDWKKIRKALIKEDLNEIESLGENRSVEKIKALRAVNRSHSDLLSEIKKSKNKIIDTDHYDNTMNLFD